ncbi:glutamine-hydrolyzing GMP synthase [Butyrivibrio sp. WCD3002]|uniref:glutamine-hydrolyzing GMP synthase n=1 Tax=Butyrivibrio sp. WCD3002 TaxID=1280676 RepID=UPI00041F637E|nr:glutamine-hydrolyzing GMP synthase [Butyrivibrio sp. WCD3002]
MAREMVVVLDFGGQYKQLIARRVRECNVYCEIHPYNIGLDKLKEMNPKGIILTGGPNSVYGDQAVLCEKELYELGIPVLGICYGAQLTAFLNGGEVKTAPLSEYGKTETFLKTDSVLFADIDTKDAGETTLLDGYGMVDTDAPVLKNDKGEFVVSTWMSHTDYIAKAPEGFAISAYTANCPVAAMENADRKIYAVQFHPEVMHSQRGTKMLRNFVYKVCGCTGDWKMSDFVERSIAEIREKVGDGRALCALSGGVDSSVAAVLMSKAIGKQLTCVFVDHGLLRKNEGDEVEAVFGPNGAYDLNFIRVNAQDRFYEALKGVEEPEKKRKIIGEMFIRVFEEEAKKIGAVDFLVQGTIYPDVVESGIGEGAVIKSHHNVGGLPDYVDFKEIIEPLRMLFKDEVRASGLELGIPEHLVFRQPFPGPGLGIRIIGEVTAEKVRIVQDADAIYREEIGKAAAAYKEENGKNPEWLPAQYFAALTNMRSVGVMGDFRTYDYAVALRAVNTSDFMTADATNIPWEILQTVMNRIINEVKGVNRVMYDLTSKPPGTIEME